MSPALALTVTILEIAVDLAAGASGDARFGEETSGGGGFKWSTLWFDAARSCESAWVELHCLQRVLMQVGTLIGSQFNICQ